MRAGRIGGCAALALALGIAALGIAALGAMAPVSAAPLPPADAALYSRLCDEVAAAYDSTRGGWVNSVGSPISPSIALGFAITRDGGFELWQTRALATVDWGWSLYDSVGGGFQERGEDIRANSAKFEKRTSSNAARLENLIDAWRASGDAVYRVRAAQVVDYFDRVLLDGRGGFIDGQVGDRQLVPLSNGMAVHAWLEWAAANADPKPRDFALKSLDRCWTECWTAGMGLLRINVFGELTKAPQLEDQVEMGRAFVLAAHLAGRAADLERAKILGDLILTNFADHKKGGWRNQAVPVQSGKIKSTPRELDPNARAALFLCELASVTGESRYREAARRGIEAWGVALEKAGPSAGDWALAVRALPTAELTARPEWQGHANVKPKAQPAVAPSTNQRKI